MENVMMLLEWIFQDLGHFIGTLLLVGAITNIFSGLFSRNIYHRNIKDKEE